MNYGKYQAKKTFYNGVEFKSNLEARVAERFDELGIEWQYEPRCFRDKNFAGGQYTPDFYLPDSDLYIEVAGIIDDRHIQNFRRFREMFDKEITDEVGHLDYEHISLLMINSDGDFVIPRTELSFFRGWDADCLCQCSKCGKWWAQEMCGFWHCEHCDYGDGDHTFKQVISNIFD